MGSMYLVLNKTPDLFKSSDLWGAGRLQYIYIYIFKFISSEALAFYSGKLQPEMSSEPKLLSVESSHLQNIIL